MSSNNRRRVHTAGLMFLAVVIALAIWLVANRSRTGNPAIIAAPASAELIQASQGMPEYTISAIFDPDAHTLRCQQLIAWQNNTGDMLDTITLRAYANAFASSDTSPAASSELNDICYGINGFNPGGIDISLITVADKNADWSYADDAHTVIQIKITPLIPSGSLDIALTYTITVPECAYRFGYSDSVFAFGNAFPILAVYENGQWRADSYGPVGDPFFSECANWHVTLTAPEGWVCVSSGISSATSPNSYDAYATRDFALVLSNKFVSASEKASGIIVNAYSANSSQARAIARAGAKAINIFTSLFGDYPWPTYNLATVSMPFGGMEYPCLSMVASSGFANSTELNRAIAHETAHQWFYSLVGSDPINDPWLDESLCSYATLMYIEEAEGTKAAQAYLRQEIEPSFQLTIPRGVTIGAPLWAFGSINEYRVIVYERGTGMLWGLSEAMGADVFRAALNDYINISRYSIATRDDFIAALNKASGSDWNGYMIDYLDTYILGTW